jgi:perosamine synthetase
MKTNWISSQGKYIQQFEEQFSSYHDVSHGVAVSNCTAALHISLKALGVGVGDEVICPALTFISPANMVKLSQANLVLVDIDPETLNLDPVKLKKAITKKTKAIIVVHQFGHAAPMDEIMDLAREHNLKIIEDNAEAVGGRYKGRILGSIGDISCFSFFANKIMTTGEGGMILTSDENLARRCRILRDHGMSVEKRYHHVELGFNYRMTNLQAAIGLAQLENLPGILEKRRSQMDRYYELLSQIKGVELRQFKEWTDPVHWLMTISLKNMDRDQFIELMKREGVECRPMIFPVLCAQHLRDDFDLSDYSNAKNVSLRSVHLPSSTNLSDKNMEYIAKCIRSIVS